MLKKIEAAVDGSEIELHLADENGTGLFRLNRHEMTHLLLKLMEAIQSIPSGPTESLGIEGPALIAWPSFQVGVMPDGEIAVRIRLDPLPPMELRFDDDAARKLIEGLSQGLTMPREYRSAGPRH